MEEWIIIWRTLQTVKEAVSWAVCIFVLARAEGEAYGMCNEVVKHRVTRSSVAEGK